MKYELRTQLSLEECVQILHEKSRFDLGLPFRSDSNPFLGQVGPQGVSLYLAQSHKNPLAPRFNGTFKKTAIGTILQGEITTFGIQKKTGYPAGCTTGIRRLRYNSHKRIRNYLSRNRYTA